MVSIRIDLAEAKRIEREAQKILKAKAQGVSVRKVRASPEARTYAKQLTSYKKKTGKRRLTYDEKKALHHFTSGQVSKRIDKGSKAYERRLKSFEKAYGPADDQARYVLEYLAPAAAARKLELKKIEPPKGEPDDDLEEATFTKVTLPGKTWAELPADFKKWARASGSYMYENHEFFWKDNSADIIDMQKLFDKGVDGDDHTNHDFFIKYTNVLWNGAYIYDPKYDLTETEPTETHVMILAREWAEVEELPDDWATTRKYYRKRK